LNKTELKSHGFKKVGFFVHRMLKADPNEIIYFAKNCELTYLKEEIGSTIFPILDTKSGSAIMYGTSSYLWFKKELLLRFAFQIIQNKIIAKKHLTDIKERLLDSIGEPASSVNPLITWRLENQELVLEFPTNGHGYIYLKLTN
jgi:hypothetical protein